MNSAIHSWPASGGPDQGADEDALAETAADWIVQLSADDAAEREAAARGFEAWKAADPAHAAAAAGMERFLGLTRQLGAQSGTSTRAARDTLGHLLDDGPASPAQPRRPRQRRRRKAGVVALLLLVGLASLLFFSSGRPAVLMADLRTVVGEQRSVALADGSRLLLAGDSAVDIQFDPAQRRLRLLRGEILVDVAAEPGRAFEVATEHGVVQALGTRFLVQGDDSQTVVTMLESRVQVIARAAPSQALDLGPGQRLRLDDHGSHPLPAVDPGAVEDAFRLRRLVVQDQPLPIVLERLARERPGYLYYDSARLAAIRVSAVLPLDDTDQALQLLHESFPQLRIRPMTAWLTLVDQTP